MAVGTGVEHPPVRRHGEHARSYVRGSAPTTPDMDRRCAVSSAGRPSDARFRQPRPGVSPAVQVHRLLDDAAVLRERQVRANAQAAHLVQGPAREGRRRDTILAVAEERRRRRGCVGLHDNQ